MHQTNPKQDKQEDGLKEIASKLGIELSRDALKNAERIGYSGNVRAVFSYTLQSGVHAGDDVSQWQPAVEVYVNGNLHHTLNCPVGTGPLTASTPADSTDITGLLRSGENVIEVKYKIIYLFNQARMVVHADVDPLHGPTDKVINGDLPSSPPAGPHGLTENTHRIPFTWSV